MATPLQVLDVVQARVQLHDVKAVDIADDKAVVLGNGNELAIRRQRGLHGGFVHVTARQGDHSIGDRNIRVDSDA